MSSRTGVPTALYRTRRLCQILVKYQVIIKALDPDNTDLSDAIDAMIVACTVLEPLLESVRDYGD